MGWRRWDSRGGQRRRRERLVQDAWRRKAFLAEYSLGQSGLYTATERMGMRFPQAMEVRRPWRSFADVRLVPRRMR